MKNATMTTEVAMKIVIEVLNESGIAFELNRKAPGDFDPTKAAAWTDCYPPLAFNDAGEAVMGVGFPSESEGNPLKSIDIWYSTPLVAESLMTAFGVVGFTPYLVPYAQKVSITF